MFDTILIRKTTYISILCASALCAQNPEQNNLEFDFYGSIRAQGEIVRSDREAILPSYEGFRGGYSRIGAKATYTINDSLDFMGQIEIPFDIVNFEAQGPYEQNKRSGDVGDYDDIVRDSLRIAKIGLRSQDYGSIYYGQMWVPYYNAIAYPVDMFSTYYSGFATFSNFRLDKTLSYYSPNLYGFSFALGWSEENGQMKADGRSDDRYQATVSYGFDATNISIGLDDHGGMNNAKVLGASISHTIKDIVGGDVYLAAKYEQHRSDITDGYGEDKSSSKNLFASYTKDKFTYKAMVADTDNYGELVYHLGIDYQLTPSLQVYGEYYHEQETAAITQKKGGLADTLWDSSGGDVYALGFRYDF